jgi:hypothetical protein
MLPTPIATSPSSYSSYSSSYSFSSSPASYSSYSSFYSSFFLSLLFFFFFLLFFLSFFFPFFLYFFLTIYQISLWQRRIELSRPPLDGAKRPEIYREANPGKASQGKTKARQDSVMKDRSRQGKERTIFSG